MEKFRADIYKEIASERDSLMEIEPILLNLRDNMKLPQEKFYNLLIAVTEALNNAIIHGNRCDPDKTVKVHIQALENEIIVDIEDEGAGFDPDSIEDPRKPENLLKDNGRGVFLIKTLMSETNYDFSGKGTRLSMHFKLNI